MKIIPSVEANSNPVGCGQEDPNTDPFLERPMEGRGIGDFLKGVGFGFNMNWLFWKKVILAVMFIGSATVTICILFFKPGILVN